ncbi:MAG TPA: hypothetical protein PL157_01615 [Acidobacteriota bacterium]|nr:hypothetical protein [Acidobacteriota bacterium]
MKSVQKNINLKTIFLVVALLLAVGLPIPGVADGVSAGLLAQVRAQGKSKVKDNRLKSFTIADLIGRYAVLALENDTTPDGAPYHAACVGMITFDGKGAFIDKETHSFNGQIVVAELTGTYTMNPDGTGVLTFHGTGPDGQPLTFEEPFALSNGGKEITALVSIEGVVSYATMKKQ